MKKIIFAAVLLLTVTSAFAQLNFGIKASYNSSLGLNNLGSVTTGDYNLNSVKSELSNGFQAGVFFRLGLKKVYFEPEFLYNMGKKDYTISFQDALKNNVRFDKLVNVSTLDVPLLLGYKLLDLKLVNLRVFAGPKLRFNAGSSLDYSNLSTGGSVTQNQLVKDIKAAQLGLEAGVGVDVLMFTLDARYQIINDMYQTKLSSLTIDNIPANTFVISLGWKFF
ncbi:MAG: outer membrane beta-barrel protein [Paludibacter sp.]|nr:outer membrane beta-barrel protein [Paludibacter sp.]